MFGSDCGVFSLFEYDVTACNSHLLPCVWVDFNYTGTAKGSYYRPYKTLGMAVDSVEVEGTIMLKAGSSPDTLTINKEVYLRSHEGTADIGGP